MHDDIPEAKVGSDFLMRLPPHSPEAEQGVLGSILLRPDECLNLSVQKLEGGEVFYDLRHRTIYEHMLKIGGENPANLDVISLNQSLKDAKVIEEVGGVAYLVSMQDMVPSSANIEYYLTIVFEKYILRRIIQTCTDAVARVYECEGEPMTLLGEVEQDILKINRSSGCAEEEDVVALVKKSVTAIQIMCENQGKISGISTGLKDLDKVTDGMHGGELIVIAAYPSVGKTSLAMNIAEHVVLREKKAVGVFSFEMSGVSLVTRFICSHARVNLRNIRNGYLTEADFPRIAQSATEISKAAMHFECNGDLTVPQMRAKARRWKQAHNVELIIVDYIQKVRASGRKDGNREREVADISDGLKSMAMELGVPVIALSQLNDDGKLRESRSIGQDADGVWMLKRNDSESNEQTDSVILELQKQRNEERGVIIPLIFLKKFTRFELRGREND